MPSLGGSPEVPCARCGKRVRPHRVGRPVSRVPLGTGSAREEDLLPRGPRGDDSDGRVRDAARAGGSHRAAHLGAGRARDLRDRAADRGAAGDGVHAMMRRWAMRGWAGQLVRRRWTCCAVSPRSALPIRPSAGPNQRHHLQRRPRPGPPGDRGEGAEGRLDPPARRGQAGPSSIISLDPAVAIGEARYDADVGEQSVLRRAIGKTFEFQTGSPYGPLRATLLGVNPEVWRLPDSSIVFYRPGQLRYTDDMVVAQPVLELRVQAAAAEELAQSRVLHHRRELAGHLRGGARGRQGADRGDSPRFRCRRSASTAPRCSCWRGASGGSASLRRRRDAVMNAALESDRMDARDGRRRSEESVGEVHVYSLPGRWTLQPGTTSLIPLFEPASAAVTREYAVRRPQFYYRHRARAGRPASRCRCRWTTRSTAGAARRSATGRCQAARSRIFDRDRDGRLQLVGEAGRRSTLPPGRIWSSRPATRSTSPPAASRPSSPPSATAARPGVRIRATAAYEVALTNARDSAVTVSVYEQRGGEWSVTASSVPAEKVSATTARFRVPVPARGSATLTYRIRAVW